MLQILSHIVMSFEIQLVGKLSPPVQLETLCLLLPGYCSGAKSIESPNAPAEDFQRESESEAYLNKIQAGEWKRHDHYKILGLGHLRMAATDDAIKQAYRKMILLHHPDKKDNREDNIFKCIQKAFDILSDPTLRKQFDSVDPTVIDTVPSIRSIDSFDQFKQIFDPIFESQQRFSKKQPVPLVGTMETERNLVEDFYRFWSNFESWRSFEWYDEEQPTTADSRDDKRWFDKKNKAARQKLKNEDNARIIKLIELAMKHDPRIKLFKEQDKAQKEAKKQASKSPRSSTPVSSQAAKQTDEMKQREQALLAARQRMLDEKVQRDKTRVATKTIRDFIEGIMIENNYFLPSSCSSEEIENQIAKLDAKFAAFSLEQLQQFKENLIKNGAKAMEDAPAQTQVLPVEWSSVEMQLLIEAVKQFPGGVSNRWERIATFVANKSKLPERPLDDIIQQATALKNAPKATGSVDALLHETQIHKPKSVDSRIHQNVPTDASNVMTPATNEETVASLWSAAEFTLLENGLSIYPSTDPERWDKISAMVGSKSKKECKKKFIEIAEKLKSAKK